VKHIVIVDDDPAIRTMIVNYLTEQGFRASGAADGGAMGRLLDAGGADLVILDLRLGSEDGMDIVRRIRAESNLPIIIVTGQRRDEVDRIIGLELGADDYLTKPLNLRELLARVRAVLRRAAAPAPGPENGKRARYRFAGWQLDLRRRELLSPGGEKVALTKGELNVLAAFVQAPQRVLSREQLLAATRVHDEEVYDRSVDVQILRLRRKLETDPSAPQLIRTERGAGYVFAVPVELA
jgi:DNA-binding response OmpR family regulator